MAQLFFTTNAVLYIIFAAWCTLAPVKSSQALGYMTLSPSGSAEYLVVYGGLQVALALVFSGAAFGLLPDKIGLMMAIAVYAPLVAYRAVTWMVYKPDTTTALATAVLELGLLVAAVFLYVQTH